MLLWNVIGKFVFLSLLKKKSAKNVVSVSNLDSFLEYSILSCYLHHLPLCVFRSFSFLLPGDPNKDATTNYSLNGPNLLSSIKTREIQFFASNLSLSHSSQGQDGNAHDVYKKSCHRYSSRPTKRKHGGRPDHDRI